MNFSIPVDSLWSDELHSSKFMSGNYGLDKPCNRGFTNLASLLPSATASCVLREPGLTLKETLIALIYRYLTVIVTEKGNPLFPPKEQDQLSSSNHLAKDS